MPDETDIHLIDADAPAEDAAQVDPATEAKLREAGIKVEGMGTPDAEEVKVETTEAPETAEEDPLKQEIAPEEVPLILGKYKEPEDAYHALEEAQRKITELGQGNAQFAQLQGAFDQIARDPQGAQILARLASGQPAPPTRPDIPTGPQFQEWLGQDLQSNLGQFVGQHIQPMTERQGRLEGMVNSIYAHLEQQAVKEKYGTLDGLQPYLERVNQTLGQQAGYYPQEHKVLMARGLKAGDDAAQTASQEQTKQQDKEAKDKHREAAIAAAVETADVTAEPGRVVDFSKLSTADKRKKLIEMGAVVVHRD